MGIYTAPSVLAYTVSGASLNTYLPLSAGTYNTVVQEWDKCGSTKTPVTVTVSGGTSSVPASSHVIVVMEENHSYSSVIGSSSMPYLNSLASKYGLATQYYANTHPSIGNYLMLTTGAIITNNDSFCSTISNDNVVRHLLTAGKTWKSYAESLPYAGYTGCGTGEYAKKHNPLAFFSDVANSSEKYNLVPFTQFSKDLASNALPNFSFIVPNQCNDQHGRGNAGNTCAFDPQTNGSQSGLNPALIYRGDVTVQQIVEAIWASPAWKVGDNAIVVMWDENDYSLAPNINKVAVIVYTNTDPAKGEKGITAIVVEKGTPGFKVGKEEKKLGINATACSELVFTDCVVPVGNRIGNEGEGYKVALSTLDGGRIGIAAQAVGIAQGAFEAALKWSQERMAFGHPIAQFQAIQFMLADMATEIDAARLLVRKAAWKQDSGGRFSQEAATAKLFASEMSTRVAHKAIQIHGGYGYSKEYPVERAYRDARITEIYEGTSEIQRLVIAGWLLKS